MPPPVVYAAVVVVGVATAYAFHKFVYEPVIAPQFEIWAENYLEKRRQKKQKQNRQKPVPAQPVNARKDKNTTARSSAVGRRAEDANGMSGSIELQNIAERERNEWSQSATSSHLRHRRTTAVPEEPDVPIHYPVMTPTHVIADTSAPSSPGGQSIRTSALPSVDNSPAYHSMSLSGPSGSRPPVSKSPTPSPQVTSPKVKLPPSTPDDYPSPCATPPPTMPHERSPLSMRRPPADLSTSLPASSSYSTPLGGSLLLEADIARAYTDPLSYPVDSRVQSPFSDVHSVDAWLSSPEHIHISHAGAQTAPPDDVRSPSMASDMTLGSDEDFDVMSPRSGMFSPPGRNAHVDDDPFEVGSEHESEASWTSVRPHSPRSPF